MKTIHVKVSDADFALLEAAHGHPAVWLGDYVGDALKEAQKALDGVECPSGPPPWE